MNELNFFRIIRKEEFNALEKKLLNLLDAMQKQTSSLISSNPNPKNHNGLQLPLLQVPLFRRKKHTPFKAHLNHILSMHERRLDFLSIYINAKLIYRRFA